MFALRSPDGQLHPPSDAPNVLAQHFANLWSAKIGPATDYEMELRIAVRPAIFPDSASLPPSIDEIRWAISTLRTGKAPGPNEISVDVYRSLPLGALELLATKLARHWDLCHYPSNFTSSIVVCLPKQGDASLPANYRPLSLSNTEYKILGKIIHRRLSTVLSPILDKLQFGFLAGKSTSDAIYLIRRALECFEASQDDAILLFLDWSKAFDTVDHPALFACLIVLGVPGPLVRNIAALYQDISFSVRQNMQLSSVHPQKRGIRQGCPLSPFLFLCVLHCAFRIVDHHTPANIRSLSYDIPFNRVIYADDTALLARTAARATTLLRLVQKTALPFGLELNDRKCVLLTLRPVARVKLLDGGLVPRKDCANYLGVAIHASSSPKAELLRRLGIASTSFQALLVYWRKARQNLKTKFLVFEAVVVSQLVYAIASLALNTAQERRLDAFYIRCLRRILQLPSSFVDRRNTNARIYHDMQVAIGARKPILPLTYRVRHKQVLWLGHILRETPGSNHRVCSFVEDTLEPRKPVLKRPGRPRVHWSTVTTKHAYELYRERNPQVLPWSNSIEQRRQLEALAIAREWPFKAN